MQVYWLTELESEECICVDAETVERVLGVEISYIDWVLETDGQFENETWRLNIGQCAS